jgi:ribosomal protein S3
MTKYGVLGVKVWIEKGVLSNKNVTAAPAATTPAKKIGL